MGDRPWGNSCRVGIRQAYLLDSHRRKYRIGVSVFGALFVGYSGHWAIHLNIHQLQQQAMFLAWFFMVIFILMSGLFTAIESMPPWAKILTWFNPVAYMVELMRMVLLKGSGFMDIGGILLVLLLFGFIVNGFAVANYRKGAG